MIYESNMQQVILDISTKLKRLTPVLHDKCTREIATDLMFANKRRVYTEGEDVDGGKIGKYSTKPTLVGAKSFIKKASVNKVFGKGKNKKLQWRTVNGHRLAILPGGYKQIRQIEGFETAHVNLTRSRKMMKELSVGRVNGVWCVGFPSKYNSGLSYKAIVS